LRTKKIGYIVFSAFYLFLSYFIYIIADINQRKLYLNYESGFYEVSGAIFFLLSSIVFLIIFFKNRNIFFLFLGMLVLIAFFEEISWGQRIFQIETPSYLKEINAQGEINLHNLQIFHGINKDGSTKSGLSNMITAERLFNLIWFMAFILLPFLYKYNKKIKKQLEKIKFPIIPISISILFILNYLCAKLMSINGIHVQEIKESDIAFLFLVVSIWFLYKKVIFTPNFQHVQK